MKAKHRKPGRALPKSRVKPLSTPPPLVIPSRFGLTKGQLALEMAALDLYQASMDAHDVKELSLVGMAHASWVRADHVFREAARARRLEVDAELRALERNREIDEEIADLQRAKRR